MASTYGNDLRLEEIGDGEQSGTWGATTNTNLELISEALSFGTEGITTNDDSHATVIADGASDPGRSLYLKYTGTLDSTCTITITPAAVSKVWYIENGTSGSQSIIISCGSGANVTIPTGQTKVVYSDGSGAMAEIGTLGVTNLAVTTNATIGGNATITGNIDVDGVTNLDAVDIDGAVQLDSTLTVGANDQGYDVTLYGDTAARNATWDSSADSLIFTDNTKAVFGTGSDASILFDGTDMKVGATAGHLDLFTSEVGSSVRILGSGESLAEFTDDGDVDLFHNGTLKMSTTATGISVAGSVVDNLTRGSIKVGNSSGVFAPLSIGGANTLLQSNGTDAAWATVSGSDSRQNYVADGNVTARQAVFLKDTGKVSATQSLKVKSRANVGSTGATPAMSVANDGYGKSANAYSTVDNVHVTIYLKGGWASGVNNAVVVVSQINADGSITSGSDNNNAFGSGTYRSPSSVQMQYSSTINKFIILYTYKTSAGDHYLRMAIGTLSGNAGAANKTFTLSNEISIGSENTSYRMDGYQGTTGNYGGVLPGAGGNIFFTPDGSNIKGFFFSPYCKISQGSGTLGANLVGFTVAANGTTAISGFVPVTGGPAAAGNIASLYGYTHTAHYHIPTNQWVLASTYSANGFVWLFTQGSGSTTVSQITNDDKINFATAGIVGQNAQFTTATMQTIDNTHLYMYCANGPYKRVYRFTIGSTTIAGGTGNDFTELTEINPATGNIADYQPADAGWRHYTGFKAYKETGLGVYQGWCYQPEYNLSYANGKKIIFSEFIFTGTDGALGFLTQSNYLNSVGSTPLEAIMINGCGSYDDERNAFFMFGWCGEPSVTNFAQNPLQKAIFSADFIGSGTVPIGVHDSASTVSSGATASIGMFGSVIEGYSGLSVGETVAASNGKNVGYAIAATKVMVTETN